VRGETATVEAESDIPVDDAVVRREDPTVDPRWDTDLSDCPGATFFHGGSWARVLQATYGFTPVYFTSRSSGRLQAVLPMMEVDSWLTGRRGVSLPFTDECAPLCPDPEAFKPLYQEALDYGKARAWKYLECRGGRALFDSAPASVSFLGHRLDLRGGETALFDGCESSVRRAIRKAEQSELTIEFSQDIEAVQAFHGLLCKTRRRHGVPPQPFAFFASIQKHVLARKQGWVVLARLGNVPVAGAVYFLFEKTVIYKYGASDEVFQQLRANNLVMWEAIKRSSAEGYDILDFGRSSLTMGGLQKFKLSWGATEHRIDYVRRDLRSAGYAVVGDGASGWQTRIFRMLPNSLLKLMGAVLYKHVG
jgi:hypothetical protein